MVIFWTAEDKNGWLGTELLQGRLRQGWGGPNTQLTENGVQVPHNLWAARFGLWVKETWNETVSAEGGKNRHGILLRMTTLVRGDLVVVPRLPRLQEFVIAKVGDGYTFDDSQFDRVRDFGHTVRLHKESLRIFGYQSSPEAAAVVAKFRHYRSAVSNVADANYAQMVKDLYNMAA